MKKFDAQLFADRLQLKQRAMYLSVGDAAKEIGIHKSILSRLNRMKFTHDVYTYYVCCKWLEVEMQFFFK